MGRVRRYVALPVLAACALLAFEIPAPSPQLWSGIWNTAVEQGPADAQAAPREPIRRVSQSGYLYGRCDAVISAVLLSPEPCDALWRERLVLLRAGLRPTTEPSPALGSSIETSG